MFQYTVRRGDTLDAIANLFGVAIQDILLANAGLDPNALYPGQVLLMPISNNLYQRYPWYIYFPNLFISYPLSYWDDRRRWPGWPNMFQGSWYGHQGIPGVPLQPWVGPHGGPGGPFRPWIGPQGMFGGPHGFGRPGPGRR